MKSRLWLNILLALAVLALGGLVYFLRDTPDSTNQPLSTLKPEEITRIQIERPGMPLLLLEKQQTGWHLSKPFAARADNLKITRLLGILTARSADHLLATDLSRFDLDKPLMTLTLNQQAFGFGLFNTLNQQQYVLTNGAIYLINARHFAEAGALPNEFADKRLFAPSEQAVVFTFLQHSLTLQDGKWQIQPPTEISPDSLNAWLDEWRNASAMTVLPYAGGKTVEKLSIQLAQGGQISLAILQHEPDFILLREDQQLQYHFPAAMGKRLLSPLINSGHARTAGG